MAEVQHLWLTLLRLVGLGPGFPSVRNMTFRELLMKLIFSLALSCVLEHCALWKCWTLTGMDQEIWLHSVPGLGMFAIEYSVALCKGC